MHWRPCPFVALGTKIFTAQPLENSPTLYSGIWAPRCLLAPKHSQRTIFLAWTIEYAHRVFGERPRGVLVRQMTQVRNPAQESQTIAFGHSRACQPTRPTEHRAQDLENSRPSQRQKKPPQYYRSYYTLYYNFYYKTTIFALLRPKALYTITRIEPTAFNM